jgi:hypothetical protein
MHVLFMVWPILLPCRFRKLKKDLMGEQEVVQADKPRFKFKREDAAL